MDVPCSCPLLLSPQQTREPTRLFSVSVATPWSLLCVERTTTTDWTGGGVTVRGGPFPLRIPTRPGPSVESLPWRLRRFVDPRKDHTSRPVFSLRPGAPLRRRGGPRNQPLGSTRRRCRPPESPRSTETKDNFFASNINVINFWSCLFPPSLGAFRQSDL